MEFDLVVEGEAVLPSGVEHLQIGVLEGLIRQMKKTGLRGRRIDATGCLIFPGFIDPHVHLREPGWEHKETFQTGSRAAAHGGVTTMFDMPNNPRPASTPGALKVKMELARRTPIDILFFGGVSSDNLDSLHLLRDLVVGYKIYLAESTGGLLLDKELLGQALAEIAKARKPASIHCEDQQAIEEGQRKAASHRGITRHEEVRGGRTEIEAVNYVVSTMVGARDRVNFCHISTKASVALVKARKNGANVACEVTPHHIFFSRSALKGREKALQVNPPLRLESDRLALLGALKRGEVDFLATDHAPHTMAEKESPRPPSGMPGLDDYAHIVSWLIKLHGIPPESVALFTSGNQASFFGLHDRGALQVGRLADLAVVDLHSPERVRPEGVFTKCGWSPYEGIEFPGRARWTLKRGRVMLEDGNPAA